jgi:hypothetical protein
MGVPVGGAGFGGLAPWTRAGAGVAATGFGRCVALVIGFSLWCGRFLGDWLSAQALTHEKTPADQWSYEGRAFDAA